MQHRASKASEPDPKPIDPEISRAAAALSKLGAAKGGQARAVAMTPKKRSAIAKKAARARWAKEKA